MSVAYVAPADALITDDEAFEQADDEVGIYEVRPVDIEPIDIPEPATDADDASSVDPAPARTRRKTQASTSPDRIRPATNQEISTRTPRLFPRRTRTTPPRSQAPRRILHPGTSTTAATPPSSMTSQWTAGRPPPNRRSRSPRPNLTNRQTTRRPILQTNPRPPTTRPPPGRRKTAETAPEAGTNEPTAETDEPTAETSDPAAPETDSPTTERTDTAARSEPDATDDPHPGATSASSTDRSSTDRSSGQQSPHPAATRDRPIGRRADGQRRQTRVHRRQTADSDPAARPRAGRRATSKSGPSRRSTRP